MNIPNCHQRNYKVLIFLLKRKYRCGPNIEPWVYSSANFGPFTIWDFLYLGFWVFVNSKHLKNLSRDDKHCYTMEVTFRLIFFWILSIVKMKFGQTLVCCMANISNMFLSINVVDCKLVPRPSITLLKWKYRHHIWPLLTIDIYHF